VFRSITLRGGAAAILCGHRPAATLRSWSIANVHGQWTLTATVERKEPIYIQQPDLLFTAPHEGARDGFWAWPVIKGTLQVGDRQLIAHLGPPEQ